MTWFFSCLAKNWKWLESIPVNIKLIQLAMTLTVWIASHYIDQKECASFLWWDLLMKFSSLAPESAYLQLTGNGSGLGKACLNWVSLKLSQAVSAVSCTMQHPSTAAVLMKLKQPKACCQMLKLKSCAHITENWCRKSGKLCTIRYKIITIKKKCSPFFSFLFFACMRNSPCADLDCSIVCLWSCRTLTVRSDKVHLAWQTSKQCCKAIQALASVIDADIHSSREALCTYLEAPCEWGRCSNVCFTSANCSTRVKAVWTELSRCYALQH